MALSTTASHPSVAERIRIVSPGCAVSRTPHNPMKASAEPLKPTGDVVTDFWPFTRVAARLTTAVLGHANTT
ncbi:Uncharacterised protein [Mycobacteroides abscessus subsp. abscessus]|nr:Uncharacterised protein [Mycobacteroides abscessus subsp. abscessus]